MDLAVAPFTVLKYDPDVFAFRPYLVDVLGWGALEDLEDLDVPVLTRKTDQSLKWQQEFYAAFPLVLAGIYLELIRSVIRPYFEEPIVYQAVPTVRVHLKGKVAVGEFHRDKDYGHAAHEVNFWLPRTDAWGTNSVWVEDGASFYPATVRQGQILVFDGANRLHGNLPNLTEQTRVSFDFRAYPRRLHKDREEDTVNRRRRFALGSYWAAL